MEIGRSQPSQKRIAILKFARVALEDGRGLRSERRVDEDGGFRYGLAVHQADDVGHQFLRSLNGEGRDEKRNAGLSGGIDFPGQEFCSLAIGNIETVPVAVGRLADHNIERRRRFRIGLQ